MKTNQQEPLMATYLHRRGRSLGIPVAGNFELTARCNFRCPMCYVHRTPEEIAGTGCRELTSGQWLTLARQAQEKGMIFALLTGGEPFLRQDFFEIYDGMKALGLFLSINTNGSLLKGQTLERILRDPPFRFNISLYGGCEETYRRMCGLAAYEQVKENIRALRSAGVQVSLNLSITPYNREDLAQICADARELDVNVKASAYMYPPIRLDADSVGRGNRLSPEEAAQCTLEWDRLRLSEEEFYAKAKAMAMCGENMAGECPEASDACVRCRSGSTSFWLTWDGRMLPCGMMTGPEVYPLETGFDRAWEQVKAAAAAIRTPAECERCSQRPLCGMCAAVCETETGRFDGVPEYMCRKTREQLRLARMITAERKGK